MKPEALYILFVLCFFSCKQKTQEAVANSKEILPAEEQELYDFVKIHSEEVWTTYKKNELKYEVSRLLSTDTGLVLIKYTLNTNEPEAVSQKFIKIESVSNNEKPSKSWEPYQKNQVLFVQIKSNSIEKRHMVEQRIDDQLRKNNLGEWFAGDMGAGGGNMLFEVNNINRSVHLIRNILFDEGLIYDDSVIARRVYTSEGDWFYEVLSPLDFTGQFLTM